MGKSGEFYSFNEVLKRLSIDETKLKRLVSEGEIRAFREGDQMKFRRADIENLDVTGSKSEEETGVIDLSGGKGDSETLTDDLIFDEGDDLDLSSAPAGMATAEISSQDTIVDEPVGGATIQMSASDANDSTDVVEPAQAQKRPAPTAVRRKVEAEEPKDTLWAVVMALTTVVLVMALIECMGIRDMSKGDGTAPDISKKMAAWFYKK